MGCSQNSDSNNISDNNSNNTISESTNVVKSVYMQETTNKQTDSKTKKEIEVKVNNKIVLESRDNKITKLTLTSKGDYSKASDEYFEEIKSSMNENSNSKVEGYDYKFETDGKINNIESSYDFSIFNDDQEKYRLYMSCGLDPESYNDDGTYPLDKLVQSLEENGYTKK